MASSSAAGRRTGDLNDMSDLRIVLLGKNVSENSRVGNTILGTTAFHSEASSYSQQHSVKISGTVEKRHITVINTPHLLQPDLSQHQITQRVRVCVSQSAPEPHVILLVLQNNDFSEEDLRRVKTVLNLFSEKTIKHTIVLTTDEETLGTEHRSVIENDFIHQLTKETGGGHVQFDEHQKSFYSVIFGRVEEMIRGNEEYLQCEIQMKAEGTSVDEDTSGSVASFRTELESDLYTTGLINKNSREREDDLRIVLLGKTGAGKSSTGNTILGRGAFISDTSLQSITKECKSISAEINGRHVTVIDTPGLFDTDLTNEEIQRELKNCISMILPGPHVFLLLISVGRFTEEEATAVKIIQETFGQNSLMFTILLFTRGDDLENKPIAQYLENPGCPLMNLIEACGNRYHVFNNKTRDRTQVSDLLKKIDDMVKENGDSYYSCKMFREMERGIQEQQMKILTDRVEQLKSEREELMNKHEEEKKRMMEEERQNNDKERKRREEEFREREERYKRDIKDMKDHEREMRDEMKREREEWKEQKQQEQQRRDEENERWRKKEQAMSDEYHQRLKQENERMRGIMEEERQNYDKERKRREGEFREREERYKTEMEMEREEWEKQKQQKQQRREEEDEKRKKIEKETWDDYYQRLKREIERRQREREELQFKHQEEKERMKIMMEEERQIQDKERKRREEKYIEREEHYKRDIKDIEDLETKVREEMRGEREEWEKQKQQERQGEEEDLYTGTPEDDEDSPSDPGCLRILLFGRTGNGKSATANTILRTDEFHSEDSSQLVTTTCQMGDFEVDIGEITSVAVIDTPGLFDTSLSKEQVQEEMMECVSLSAPGPHVFIIVLSLGEITQEERDTLEMIKMIFGSKAADFSIVLFTKGDTLRGQTIEQYVERSTNADLKKLISDCGNRFLAFNNREKRDRTQVTCLLKMIEEVKKSNDGRYFTNEMFEEAAISIDKRREMLEENKIENQDKVKELEARCEMEIKRMRQRLEEKKLKTDEERVRLENKFREKEETLRREFKKKEESDLKKQEEEEDRERSEEEEQRRAEYDQRREEMEREIENQKLQYDTQLKERDEEDRKRKGDYKKEQEKMKTEQERIMAEFRRKKEEEIKKRDLEEQMRKKQEEKEREEWKRKIKEAEDDEDIQEGIKRQQRDWEEEKKQQMREREEYNRNRKERHEEQLRKKQEELEKRRTTFETNKIEEEQMIDEEREKQIREREEKEREYEDKKTEMKRSYDQLERERKQEWKKRKREDEERRSGKRKRWEKMMKDLKRELEEEIKRREREERDRREREEKECDEMEQKYEEEIEKMKKKYKDEARKQEEELNDFRKRKDEQVQELKERLEQLHEMIRLRKETKEKWTCHIM